MWPGPALVDTPLGAASDGVLAMIRNRLKGAWETNNGVEGKNRSEINRNPQKSTHLVGFCEGSLISEIFRVRFRSQLIAHVGAATLTLKHHY